jgi:ABC-type spermidine/putrescine transport system permease subunit II
MRTTTRRRTGRRFSDGSDRPRFLWVPVVLTMVLMFTPVVVVALFSLDSTSSLVNFSGFSLRWYHQALTSSSWRGSLLVSLGIAAATTLVCAVCGTLLAIGLHRAQRRASRPIQGIVVLRLVSPETATAVASLLVFTQIGFTLSNVTVIAALVAFCLPFVTVVVRSRLASLNPEVEQAAMDLGATRVHALRLAVLPLLWPAIAAAAMLCFVISFDDFVTTVFTTGLGVPPLPVRIYSMLRFGVTPVVNAIGMIMMAIALIAACGALLMLKVARRRMTIAPRSSVPVGL